MFCRSGVTPVTITTALHEISKHRDIVPACYVRSANAWVVTGLSKTGGGAAVVNDAGGIVAVFASKTAALRSIANT
jgi:hypothetical protein